MLTWNKNYKLYNWFVFYKLWIVWFLSKIKLKLKIIKVLSVELYITLFLIFDNIYEKSLKKIYEFINVQFLIVQEDKDNRGDYK